MIKSAGWLEFNLSQFSDARDLIGAFHQVRDQVLQGKLPVAFFDEFDAHNYKWLAPLLAPMQDGRFQDGQITHTLGKCVFVFAGGTSWTFDTFGPPRRAGGAKDEDGRAFRLAKGPDLKSRIDGYLNVVGPNQRRVTAAKAVAGTTRVGGHILNRDPDDLCFPIRRALMIRAELKCGWDEKLDLDEGLVNALLKVDTYTHGARSLSKVLQPLLAARPRPLRRSLSLPVSQLDMHVEAREFVALCNVPGDQSAAGRLTPAQVDAIAPAVHDTWRTLGRQGGWLRAENDKPFAELTEFEQSSNHSAAARMVDNLGLVGLQLRNGVASLSADRNVKDHLEYVLETLAEAEHEGWMSWHLAHGWRWAKERDNAKRLHPCLRPYSQLSKVDVDKDRDAVRHYPDFARRAGLHIVSEVDRDE